MKAYKPKFKYSREKISEYIPNRLFIVAILPMLMAGCSFNSMFLVPDPIPKQAKKATIITPENRDTLNLHIGAKFQPTFTDNHNVTLELDYKIESVLFDNQQGNTLNGWVMTPHYNYNGTTLVFLHGNAGNITTHYPTVIPLVKRGFKVFIFDYSGFGFSEGKATRDNVLADANAALDYWKNRKTPNTKNLVIYGQSLGGHLAVTIAERNQDKIDGLVIEGAFSSHKDIAAETAGIFGKIFVAEKYSALESIQSYKKPLLIIHSTDDKIIPLEMGKKLFEKANDPKAFFRIQKCHMCGTRYYANNIASKIKQMIKSPAAGN
ncbi:MAG: lysophospholipase [Bacteroidales bacterium]|nr:lysophospholipase [Bacteroidales bacterium]MCF8334731.1 lysophospholipase [Bacteroidales bacterium]